MLPTIDSMIMNSLFSSATPVVSKLDSIAAQGLGEAVADRPRSD